MNPADTTHVSGGPAMPLPLAAFDLPIQWGDSPLDYLAAVHQRLKFMCDILEEWAAQGCVDVATAPLFARIFPDFLRRHIADEEQALLPLIRATERGKSQTATIIDGLMQEHQVCLRHVEVIADFFNTRWSGAASDLPDDIAAVMAEFARLKRNHIAVEKNIILVIARKSLKASHLEQLKEALASAPDPVSMTQSLDELLDRNVRWAEAKSRLDPTYFRRMAEQQTPKYLWIGCSDSRVTANDVLGLDPGEVFVHRNIANVVHTSDMNILSVLEFAIEYLGIRHIIVCGHYGCGGIERILSHERGALVDHWLQPISMMYRKHRA
ncbi:MAG: carbonic anhydrase, partial [Beijerinckiaceae bacterium]